ncbi:cytochrome c oxidase subunit 2A [Cohnella cholangitidis]|uniref:Cytochrome c oxidase subunit 2A n=1 Tax=Cohnella cholangitidis TaxID=2598458 RepID=A0A7G5BUX8_9BACL|nr:cytochrome c oxidase subunit 2A [Cohnella cholangitidis]QMV40762.1 cytochrome c oxidase subunit 2A [Cohnella cholangitidis]
MRDERTAAKPNETSSAPDSKDQPLKGTFVSVLLLGAFLALVWIGIFLLFIARD